jgi:alkylhydroperoxidase family enzyme
LWLHLAVFSELSVRNLNCCSNSSSPNFLLEKTLHTMIGKLSTERARLAFRDSQTALKNWAMVTKDRASRIVAPVSRVVGTGMRTASRLWGTLTLARRFYPTLQLPSSPELATAGLSAGEDVFDPLIVRTLPRRLHALIRFRVAIRIGSEARANHAAILCQAEGWSAEQVGAASAGYDWNMFTETERLALRYTDDLTRTPLDVDMATIRMLKRQLTDDQLIELAAAITQENFKTRFQAAVSMTRAARETAA